MLRRLILLRCFLDYLILQDQTSVPSEFSYRCSLGPCLYICLIIFFSADSALGSPVQQQFFPLWDNVLHKLETDEK
jgi:hypothetical protein